MLRSKKALLVLAFASFSTLSSSVHATQQSPSWDIHWMSLINPTVTGADIYRAFVTGHYQYALQLIARRVANDPALQKRLVAAGAKYLEKIINDPTLTEDQKMTEIMRKMESSFGSYVSQRHGTLGMSFKHSIAFGVNRLEWDNRELNQTCDRIASYKYVCNGGQCRNEVTYTEEKAIISPDYAIYRNDGGNETLITTMKGGISLSTKSYDFSSPAKVLSSSMSLAYQNLYKGDNATYARPVFDDYITVNRTGGGRALAYRIVADYRPYHYKLCQPNEVVESAASFDADGDLRPDFIPAIVYETPPSIASTTTEYLSGSMLQLRMNIAGGIPPFTTTVQDKTCYTNGAVDPYCFWNIYSGLDTSDTFKPVLTVSLLDPCVQLTQAQYDVVTTDAMGRVASPQVITAHLDPQNFFQNGEQCQRY